MQDSAESDQHLLDTAREHLRERDRRTLARTLERDGSTAAVEYVRKKLAERGVAVSEDGAVVGTADDDDIDDDDSDLDDSEDEDEN